MKAGRSARSTSELQVGLLELARRLQDAHGVSEDRQLEDAVATAARLAGAERSFLRLIDGRGQILAAYSWSVDAGAQEPFNGEDLQEARVSFPWTAKRFLAGEVTRVHRMADLPAEAAGERALFEARGVLSWLSIPFRSGGLALGYQSFETLSYEKDWTEEEVSALRLMAEFLAATIMRVRAEEGRQESEARFFRVFHDHTDGMVISRIRDGVIVECNPAWLAASGLEDTTQAIGRSVLDFAQDVDGLDFKQMARELSESGVTPQVEVYATGPDGEPRVVLASTSLIDWVGESCVLATIRDVTERKQLEVQLQQAQKMEAVGLLAGGIAHDFNNMLTVILGETARLVTDLEPELPGVRAEASRLEQALVNLALNAREALPGARGVITLRTRRTEVTRGAPEEGAGLPPGPYVEIAVCDDGVGIAPEVLARATEPFFTTRAEGTGLGLAIVHGVARSGGGALLLASELGVGTTARILLPAASEALSRRAKIPQAELASLQQAPLHVLLVEDEVLLRRLVRRILERKGHKVSEVDNGRSALELVRTMEQPPDLLITDVVMPELGGLSLAQQLRKEHPRLPVIVMSGYPDRGAETDPAGLVRDAVFLFKPFPPAVLLDALGEACARVR